MIGRTNVSGSGGGGGGGFELTVYGGTTRPAKASHNAIWIETDEEITSHVLSATEPANPVEGMAWVTIGASGIIKIASPVGGDWITVYPISAKQYIGGAWVDKEAKSYQEGEWVEWFAGTYLYNEGDECATITGGWSSGQVFDDGPGTFTTDGGMLNLAHTTGRYSSNAVQSVNKIPLSTASTLKCNVVSMSGTHEGFKLGVSTKNCKPIDATAIVDISKTGETVLDVSGLTDSYYVYIFSYTTNTKFSYSVDKVWYE